jgi:polyisoprenoid-binding protein YceI
MTKRLCLGLTALALVAAPLTPARSDDFKIDESHTSVIFGISHLGYSFTYGRFYKVQGGFTLEPGKPAASTFQLAIETASVDTNDAKRDEHLRGPDFFNAGEFPAITFKSTKAAPKQTDDGIVLEVTGELTMHGVTRPVTLELQKLGEGPGPGGNDFRTGFNCQTKLKRSEFGMTKMVGPIGDEVAVMISFEGVRQEGEAAATTGARTRTNQTAVR